MTHFAPDPFYPSIPYCRKASFLFIILNLTDTVGKVWIVWLFKKRQQTWWKSQIKNWTFQRKPAIDITIVWFSKPDDNNFCNILKKSQIAYIILNFGTDQLYLFSRKRNYLKLQRVYLLHGLTLWLIELQVIETYCEPLYLQTIWQCAKRTEYIRIENIRLHFLTKMCYQCIWITHN